MKIIPCKDCICLAICKSQVIQNCEKQIDRSSYDNLYVNDKFYFSAKEVLMGKCSIFKKYVNLSKDNRYLSPYMTPRVLEILKYMELIK